jgi:hypothetical protein
MCNKVGTALIDVLDAAIVLVKDLLTSLRCVFRTQNMNMAAVSTSYSQAFQQYFGL